MKNEAQYDLDRKASKISAWSSNDLDKYECLTGEYLGLKPSTIEQTKFEYSPLGKIFNKGFSEDDKKEGLFKRLQNIEGKIKGKTKKESEPIKNEEQSEVLKDESTAAYKKSKEIVLLKDELDYIFKNFGPNFNSTGKKFLIKLAKDEKIDYNNLFFQINDKSVVKSVNFLEETGTFYDLLIYLLDNPMRIISFTQIQGDFFKAIAALKIIISDLKTDNTHQSEEQKPKIFAKQ